MNGKRITQRFWIKAGGVQQGCRRPREPALLKKGRVARCLLHYSAPILVKIFDKLPLILAQFAHLDCGYRRYTDSSRVAL